jgi:hypothetical protein
MPDTTTELLELIANSHDMLVCTRKRDGTWVPTPVNPVVEGGRVFFRTWGESGKAKRLRNFSEVRLAPSTRRGEPTGPTLIGQATLLDGEHDQHAAALINRHYPLLQGLAVRAFHRLRRLHTQHYSIAGVRPLS